MVSLEDFMSCMKLTFGTPLRVYIVILCFLAQHSKVIIITGRQVIYRSSSKKKTFSDIIYPLGCLLNATFFVRVGYLFYYNIFDLSGFSVELLN